VGASVAEPSVQILARVQLAGVWAVATVKWHPMPRSRPVARQLVPVGAIKPSQVVGVVQVLGLVPELNWQPVAGKNFPRAVQMGKLVPSVQAVALAHEPRALLVPGV
jgi:hypothetical protein